MSDVECAVYHEDSGARCHLDAGHGGHHNAWAHYPGQLVSWTRPTPDASGDAGEGGGS